MQKKARENHRMLYRTVRDISKYDADIFKALLIASDWTEFHSMDNIEKMLSLLYEKM